MIIGASPRSSSAAAARASTGPWPSVPASSARFVGGLLASLLAGDGLAFKPSGLIGSFIGAVLVTLVWRWWQGRNAAPAPTTARRR